MCRYTQVDENAECRRLEIGEQELEDLLYEVINKQAQVIRGIDKISDAAGISVKTEQQIEYEKQIEKRNEEKRNLYERFVLGEVSVEAYKTEKAAIDEDINRLTHSLDALKSEVAALSAVKESDDEVKRLAGIAVGEDKLSRSLVDLLIDKVYVYPGNRVEIVWKVKDFGSGNGK